MWSASFRLDRYSVWSMFLEFEILARSLASQSTGQQLELQFASSRQAGCPHLWHGDGILLHGSTARRCRRWPRWWSFVNIRPSGLTEDVCNAA